jgi:hypothetical protein
MSSTTLAKASLCKNTVDYESLLASISIVKEILDCDTEGKVASGPSTDILKKLFEIGDGTGVYWYTLNGTDDGKPKSVSNNWLLDNNMDEFDVNTTFPYSCFEPIKIAFYAKNCHIECCDFTPSALSDECVKNAFLYLGLATDGSESFEDVIDAFAQFLSGQSNSASNTNICEADDLAVPPIVIAQLDDTQNILRAFCLFIRQMVATNRYIRKVALTVSECDL